MSRYKENPMFSDGESTQGGRLSSSTFTTGAESSILVNKTPTRTQTKRVTITTRSEYGKNGLGGFQQHQHKYASDDSSGTITKTGRSVTPTFIEGKPPASSQEFKQKRHHQSFESLHQKKSSSKDHRDEEVQFTYEFPKYAICPPDSSTIRLDSPSMHEKPKLSELNYANPTETRGLSDLNVSPFLSTSELERNVRRLSQSELISAYLDLCETVRRFDRQAELREDLLKRNQRNLESKEKTLREKLISIRQMEQQIMTLTEENRTLVTTQRKMEQQVSTLREENNYLSTTQRQQQEEQQRMYQQKLQEQQQQLYQQKQSQYLNESTKTTTTTSTQQQSEHLSTVAPSAPSSLASSTLKKNWLMTGSSLKGIEGPHIKCRYYHQGCGYKLPSMDFHEDRECTYRPARCPSLTCPQKPPFAKLLQHIEEEHQGGVKGRDRISRNDTNHLLSSYVNVDKEPIFYKQTRMTWVANELQLDGYHFFLECMRVPPEWHLWVYIIGGEKEAAMFQTTITLFREDEYEKVGSRAPSQIGYYPQGPQLRPMSPMPASKATTAFSDGEDGDGEAGFTTQRSYSGQVISIHHSKEEISEYGLGFMVHDKSIRPLCGTVKDDEEQLFGYEVIVYRRNTLP